MKKGSLIFVLVVGIAAGIFLFSAVKMLYAKDSSKNVRLQCESVSPKMFKSGCTIEYKFQLIEGKKAWKDLTYEDKYIRIVFDYDGMYMNFSLFNKTESPIEIDFNRISYIDVGGKGHKVFHSGVRYINRNAPQAPLIVPPKSSVEDVIVPTDYIFLEQLTSEWLRCPLLPFLLNEKVFTSMQRILPRSTCMFTTPKLFKSYCHAIRHKKLDIKLFFPLKINDKFKNYMFTFRVIDMNCK